MQETPNLILCDPFFSSFFKIEISCILFFFLIFLKKYKGMQFMMSDSKCFAQWNKLPCQNGGQPLQNMLKIAWLL
jgi:hypothetical protein